MRHVCIIGVGLIGGSLGMALRRVRRNGKRVYRVTGIGRSAKNKSQIRRRNAVDVFSTDFKSVADADVVVLCVPVQHAAAVSETILPFLKQGAIVTDVGSVKAKLVAEVRRTLSKRRDISFVGGHPIAGSEKAGVDNAIPTLFQSATCILVKDSRSSANSIVSRMWTDVGAHCLFMSATDHDKALAFTSHLPHLLAFGLFQLIGVDAITRKKFKKLAAGSFRDMTRIAGSDPDVWDGIFDLNLPEIKSAWRKMQLSVAKLLQGNSSKRRQSLRRITTSKNLWT